MDEELLSRVVVVEKRDSVSVMSDPFESMEEEGGKKESSRDRSVRALYRWSLTWVLMRCKATLNLVQTFAGIKRGDAKRPRDTAA